MIFQNHLLLFYNNHNDDHTSFLVKSQFVFLKKTKRKSTHNIFDAFLWKGSPLMRKRSEQITTNLNGLGLL